MSKKQKIGAKGVIVSRQAKDGKAIAKRGKTAGKEAWIITTNDKPKTMVTSPSSAATMDEATVKYFETLKRLARR